MKTKYITLPVERVESVSERERRALAYSRKCLRRWSRQCERRAVWSAGVSLILFAGACCVKLGTMLVL